MENKQPMPVQIIPCPQYEEDEIDLKDIIKTILKYKKFIIAFTLFATILSAIYAYTKTPVYQTSTNVQLGYYDKVVTQNEILPKTFLDPYESILLIKNLPHVSSADFFKQKRKSVEYILKISVNTTSINEGKQALNNAIEFLRKKENKKISLYESNIKSQINTLNDFINKLSNENNDLKKNLQTQTNPKIYQTLLTSISNNIEKIHQAKLQIIQLKEKLQKINKLQVISKISQNQIKPKKKLIITIVFITSFIISIFLVFLMEFIKSLKESE